MASRVESTALSRLNKSVQRDTYEHSFKFHGFAATCRTSFSTTMEWNSLKMRSRKLRNDYTALPSDPVRHLKRRRCRMLHAVTLRRLLVCLACTPLLLILTILCQGVPPSYSDIRTYEQRLPQHSVAALTRVDDRPPRYLKFPGHLWGHGLNNVLQETCVSYLVVFCRCSPTPVYSCPTWPTSQMSPLSLKIILGPIYPFLGLCPVLRSARRGYP